MSGMAWRAWLAIAGCLLVLGGVAWMEWTRGSDGPHVIPLTMPHDEAELRAVLAKRTQIEAVMRADAVFPWIYFAGYLGALVFVVRGTKWQWLDLLSGAVLMGAAVHFDFRENAAVWKVLDASKDPSANLAALIPEMRSAAELKWVMIGVAAGCLRRRDSFGVLALLCPVAGFLAVAVRREFAQIEMLLFGLLMLQTGWSAIRVIQGKA